MQKNRTQKEAEQALVDMVVAVSKLAVHFSVAVVVCHRCVGELLGLFAGVVWSGVSGATSYEEPPVAVRDPGESHWLCIRVFVVHRDVHTRCSPDHG